MDVNGHNQHCPRCGKQFCWGSCSPFDAPEINQHPISPDTEQFIAEHPEVKVVHVPRIGEHLKSDEPKKSEYPPSDAPFVPMWDDPQAISPTTAPLPAEEATKLVLDELGVSWKRQNSALTVMLFTPEFKVESLSPSARDYTAHFRMDDAWHYLLAIRAKLFVAEARNSVLERERDEARRERDAISTHLTTTSTCKRHGCYVGRLCPDCAIVIEKNGDKLEDLELKAWENIGLRDELSTLREALRKLLDKLVLADKATVPFFTFCQIHGMKYEGPTWAEEFVAAERAITPPTTL